MAWIVATDCRDGQCIAFPAASAAVSYDIKNYKRELESAVSRNKGMARASLLQLEAEVQRQIAEKGSASLISINGSEFSSSDEDPMAAFTEQLKTLRDRFDDTIAKDERNNQRLGTLEALIYFERAQWPVRGLRYVTDWNEIETIMNEQRNVQ